MRIEAARHRSIVAAWIYWGNRGSRTVRRNLIPVRNLEKPARRKACLPRATQRQTPSRMHPRAAGAAVRIIAARCGNTCGPGCRGCGGRRICTIASCLPWNDAAGKRVSAHDQTLVTSMPSRIDQKMRSSGERDVECSTSIQTLDCFLFSFMFLAFHQL